MGTRALIHIKEKGMDSQTICTIYRQFDGYYEGLGVDIYNILHKGHSEILNGFGNDSEVPNHFNGMGCLAAYLVGELKNKRIGNVYIYPPNAKKCGEEYVYTLWEHEGEVWIRAHDVYAEKYFECALKDYEQNL